MNTVARDEVDRYWRTFLVARDCSLPTDTPYVDADQFGNTPEMADELAGLVVRGVKTATSGLLWGYETVSELSTEAGDFAIVLDGSGAPVCVIGFDAVDEQVDLEYGEGDRTLAWWRDNLRDYYV